MQGRENYNRTTNKSDGHRVPKLVQKVKDAVNLAPDGAVISGSEELVREKCRR